jgi:hypothetical protein
MNLCPIPFSQRWCGETRLDIAEVLLTTPSPNLFSPNANYSKNASTTIGIFLLKLLIDIEFTIVHTRDEVSFTKPCFRCKRF